MPVKSVLRLVPPEGKTIQQHLDTIQKRIKSFGAIVVGQWLVEIEAYSSNISTDKSHKQVNLIHSSDHPSLTFAVTDNGTCLTSDRGLALLMLKMKPFLMPKKTGKCEIKGWRYTLSDFVIKYGSMTIGPNPKGVAFEVEYLPCQSSKECSDYLIEIVQSIIGDYASELEIAKSILPSSSLTSVPDNMKYYWQLFTSRADQKGLESGNDKTTS